MARTPVTSITNLTSNDSSITGSFNGSNKDFVLTTELTDPQLSLRGISLTLTLDYTISGATISLVNAPRRGPLTAWGIAK